MLYTLAGLRAEGEFSQTKPLVLLCYLALEGPQVRRHLAELFWPGAVNPLGSLSVAISQLRRGLPGSIVADGNRVWASVETDAHAFLTALDSGDIRAARALYTGPFLDGVELRDCSIELEEWVYETRESLAGRFRECLTEQAEAATARGNLGEAADLATQAWYLRDARGPEPPALERLHILFRTSGLLGLARAVRQEAEELGLELPGDPAGARGFVGGASVEPEGASRLPAPKAPLVAREPELAEIETLLERPDCRLLTLVGPGGVGKTRLALQAAHEQTERGHFEGAVSFVSLASLATPDMLPAGIARGMGIALSGRRRPLQELAERIASSQRLVILDNFEHLLVEAAAVAPLSELLDRCPGLKLLVTSRERLHLGQEWVLPVEGLPLPPSGEQPGEDAASYGAVRLFVDVARRVAPEFTLTSDLLPSVVDVCRHVAGFPLGLELAASWARILPVSEIAAELNANNDFLVNAARDIDERHRSMRSAFEHSWRLLTPEEQALLQRLALFEGGFRKEAASEVAGASYPMLASLVDKSLLLVSAGGRFGQHPLMKRYAAQKLSFDEGASGDAATRHGRYYLGLLDLAERSTVAERQGIILTLLDEELDNVRAAWEWALQDGRFELLPPAAGVLGSYFEIRGRMQEGIDHFARSAQLLRDQDDEARGALGNVLIELAWLCHLVGRYSDALEHARQGLDLLEPLSDERGAAVGLETLGLASWRTGSYRQARDHLQEGLSLARSTGDGLRTAYLLSSLSAVEMGAGNYGRAALHITDALVIQKELGEDTVAIYNLYNLGRLRLLQGEPIEARAHFGEALDSARDLGFRQLIPHLLLGIARSDFARGEYLHARATGSQALEAGEESNQPQARAEALTVLAGIAAAYGSYDTAWRYCMQSLRLCRDINETPSLLNSLLVLAELEAAKGRIEHAFRLACLTAEHPVVEWPVKDGAKRLRDEISDLLSPSTVPQQPPDRIDDVLRDTIDSILSNSVASA